MAASSYAVRCSISMPITIVRCFHAYLDSLSMDDAEVAVNCLCLAGLYAMSRCPDSELAYGYCGACQYRQMAKVMEQLDGARDKVLDEDGELI
jgi:hypothetical protein